MRVSVAQDVGPLVSGDPLRVRQILQNLVSNAVKFTDAGHIEMRLIANTGPLGAPSLRFEVEDTGCGLSTDQLNRVFERFTQAAQTVLDTSTPEEMRWLAMFPKVDLSWDKALRSRFCVLGADPDLTLAWIKGGLADQLSKASQDLLLDSPPFLMMTMRDKLYLRMQLAEPAPAALAQCLELFDAALKSATSLTAQMAPDPAASPPTLGSSWQMHAQVDDPAGPLRR
jgi:hypothetical protein